MYVIVLLAAALQILSGRLVMSYENEEFLKNITRTLDGLLSETYDKGIRPDFGGPPTKVSINMHIKSLGPVSENDELYMLDVYFRQAWHDSRLGFSVPGIDEFSMSWLFLDKIWKPDTFFLNGKKSDLHKITSPNKFVRLRSDGYLTYSMRLTISARCKMYLRKFPLDSQICHLIVGSYGYTVNDVLYNWDERGVTLEPGISEAQYDIINVNTTNDLILPRGTEQYAVVKASFFFRRSIGYYVLQIYVPLTLTVFCSWISFWVTPTDVDARTTLAVTTLLSITTLGFAGRDQLPKVSHATALDWFVIICFAFAFAVMIEYAVIHFADWIASDLRKLLAERTKKEANEKAEEEHALEVALQSDEELEHIEAEEPPHPAREPYHFLPHRWYSIPIDLSKQTLRDIPEWAPATSPATESTRSTVMAHYRQTIMAPVRFWKNLHFIPRDIDPVAEEKFHRIDIVARRAFPLLFTLTILMYSLLYTYYITDRSSEEESQDLL